MQKATIITILRACHKNAQEQIAKAVARNESHAFDSGRAHAFQMALSLLDENGPEAQVVAQQLAEARQRGDELRRESKP